MTEASKRWLGVGRSADSNGETAGRDAAASALIDRNAKLLIVFCSDSYDLDAMLAGIEVAAPGVPLIGCSTAGEIATEGPGDASVVVVALGGEGFSVATAAATGAAEGLRDASAEVAACIDQVEHKEHRVLLMLSDGLAGDQQEVVRGAYSIAGASIPLVGGCAGDDLKMKSTMQLHGRTVLRNSIVAAAIASDAPMGIGVRHGWRKVGEPMLVTSSSSNRVYTLDDQPALDAYLERLNAPDAARTDPKAFTQFALTHPFGLTRRSGEEVRFIAEANFNDRSIGCIAEVPQGGLTWLMEGDLESVLAATEGACADALASLGGREPIGLLAFDCIARRGVLGDEGIRREVAEIGRLARGAPVAGFYTYGEFARTRGLSGFHNQTLVVLAVT
jgi:hypothetical protein